MAVKVDWSKVEAVMGCCVRGSGYVPNAEESYLLTRALQKDRERYAALHKRVAAEARREVNPIGAAGSELGALRELRVMGYAESDPHVRGNGVWRITQAGSDRLIAPMRLLRLEAM